MANELLEFPGSIFGIAANLDAREIGCVILGDASSIEEGDEVGGPAGSFVLVGDGFLGRGGTSGRPRTDGATSRQRRSGPWRSRPSVVQRQPVKEPLQTGIKAIDSMTAIGRGQRDIRRPPDRQDRRGHRHHHRPARELGVRRPAAAGPVHLRGHRAEGLHGAGGGVRAHRQRGHGLHGHRERAGLAARAVRAHRPVLRRGLGAH